MALASCPSRVAKQRPFPYVAATTDGSPLVCAARFVLFVGVGRCQDGRPLDNSRFVPQLIPRRESCQNSRERMVGLVDADFEFVLTTVAGDAQIPIYQRHFAVLRPVLVERAAAGVNRDVPFAATHKVQVGLARRSRPRSFRLFGAAAPTVPVAENHIVIVQVLARQALRWNGGVDSGTCRMFPAPA